jgi:hypothetical protein
MDWKTQMRITRSEELTSLAKVEDAYFGNNPLAEGDVVDVIAGFLRDEDVGVG